MGMIRFQDWYRKYNFSRAHGYRQAELGNVVITKVGNLSYVTDEDDAAFQAKLPKLQTSRSAATFLKVAECSVRKLAELIDEGAIDRGLVVGRLSEVFRQTGIQPHIT